MGERKKNSQVALKMAGQSKLVALLVIIIIIIIIRS